MTPEQQQRLGALIERMVDEDLQVSISSSWDDPEGDQVKQIGNAWPCATAEALVREILGEYAQRDTKPENLLVETSLKAVAL